MEAIAALNKALAADVRNAEVLLSLGVSYTNELDQGRALGYLSAWLAQQPSLAQVAPHCKQVNNKLHLLKRPRLSQPDLPLYLHCMEGIDPDPICIPWRAVGGESRPAKGQQSALATCPWSVSAGGTAGSVPCPIALGYN